MSAITLMTLVYERAILLGLAWYLFIFSCVWLWIARMLEQSKKNDDNKKRLFGEVKYYSTLCVTRTSMLSLFLFCVVVTLMRKMPECEFY